ncbi:MAG: site-specific DNA-methyltransferase [Parvibaculum sp.]|uniref:site-specific DNA-methyltransferase n=1 Tax=Parvibaculum sp. TaxID=2024848 RepID=UPI003264173E
MDDSLSDLILSLLPEDGNSIGNGAMLALVRERRPGVTDAEYGAARDVLIDQELIGRGKGRGGSIFLLIDTRDDDEEDEGFFELEDEDDTPAPSKPARKKKSKSKRSGEPKEVLSYRHNETRVNNPEVGMVHADTDPDGKKTAWAYDPHLDPVLNFDSARAGIETLIDDALASDDPERMKEALQELKRLQTPYLNWTGKAEKTSFELDTVSLHVHERVDPATILANASRRLRGKDAASQWRQPDMFAAPFENLPLRQALDFYRHEKGWSNRLVAGDSLLVMNSLLTKESMGGKVQMIYIDPPYGIKYGSNFQPFTNQRDVKDRSDDDLTREPEMIKAFRDTWELGLHSYLTYLRDRLMIAKELLHESGSVFLQIGDENVHHSREIMDEVFGKENFIATITIQKTGSVTGDFIQSNTDFIHWYGRSRKATKFHPLFVDREKPADSQADQTTLTRTDFGAYPMTSDGFRDTTTVDFMMNGRTFHPGDSRHWGVVVGGLERAAKSNRIIEQKAMIRLKYFHEDYPVRRLSTIWQDVGGATEKVYVVQSAPSVLQRLILMTTDPGDLVLDPTCGSGTTAFVAEKWGRRWITCDTSRVAITLAKQRLMTASFDYFVLRYPHEGLRGGFDYVTVPHVTLKSIADNADIDTIYEEDHPKILAALDALNGTLTADPPKPFKPAQGVRRGKPVNFAKGETLHEWEVPFDWPDGWPEGVRAPFDAFHKARQAMQRRMDQSIADHAEQEVLYDKPETDKNRLRITGPFSVEAVPAPTVLSLDENFAPEDADASIARTGETSRQSMWRDELLKTGVRGKGGNVIRFAEFDTLPTTRYLHASGSLADTGERVVVSFGPEHAALEQRQVEEALAEAEKLRPAPKFILFCAFAFDPEAAKDIDEVNWPGVTLLKAQMNTDLLTEDLKKKRASNESFWLMGQPELEVRKREDGFWEVEVHGFDYFNPKTGQIEGGGKSQIAMWSLDVDYDQRSLMPHQVFFPMADAKGGWNRLKKTIRAELDEDLLKQFHGTISLPFEAGDNRRIAVKIVDDRGIESLKIVPLEG